MRQSLSDYQRHVMQLGEICLLVSTSDHHQRMPYRDLMRRFIYPMSINQARMFKNQDGHPIGYVSWAWLSDELSNRMVEAGPQDLQASDWRSGTNLWFMEFVATGGGVNRMVEAMHNFVRDEFADVAFARAHKVTQQGRQIRVAKWMVNRKMSVPELREAG